MQRDGRFLALVRSGLDRDLEVLHVILSRVHVLSLRCRLRLQISSNIRVDTQVIFEECYLTSCITLLLHDFPNHPAYVRWH